MKRKGEICVCAFVHAYIYIYMYIYGKFCIKITIKDSPNKEYSQRKTGS